MAKNGSAAAQRAYLSQSDVPSLSLERALKIASTIGDNYGYRPASPLQVAKALDVTPTSGGFRMLAGASIAYGFTNGGYNADLISITNLGLRIIRPTSEGDDLAAKREALLKPRVIREFLQKYDSAPIPKDSIAQNVLMEMGVPQDRTDDVLKLIIEGAEAVGFLQTIKDRKYVELGNARIPDATACDESGEATDEFGTSNHLEIPATFSSGTTLKVVPPAAAAPAMTLINSDSRARKVFITHGKNRAFIEPIKKLLAFGELEAVVATERQTVSQPIPDKVMEAMRSCGAAIIHVEDERRLMDSEAKEHVVLNENVLIEIGGAMALYGTRFILVVKDGVQLPSNLQGLQEVRYTGDTLDGTATIKLLEAINDMKKRPLPQ
jgi:hypothetical protein